MKPSIRKTILLLKIGILVIGVIYVGSRWIQKIQFQQEVLSAIQDRNNMQRIRLVASLRDTKPQETLGILLDTMESSDPTLCRRAASALSLFTDHLADHTNVLIKHLRTDSESGVRLSCAIMLMWVKRPEVDQAYIHALHDTEEKWFRSRSWNWVLTKAQRQTRPSSRSCSIHPGEFGLRLVRR